MIAAAVMTDHPAWLPTADGASYRAVRCGHAIWEITARPRPGQSWSTCARRVVGPGTGPEADLVDPLRLNGGPKTVTTPLRAVGTVARWRNPDLWDGLATSIIRQVIRAAQARKLYRAFSRAHGERVETTLGETWLFPTPEVVLNLPEDEFTRLGMAFKRRPLQAAASAVLDTGDDWAGLAPADLVTEVQTVPRIGPWSAGATVADLTNDYALYPYSDLAVRTWAKRLAPGRTWPETEAAFASLWARWAGDQLSDWTLLTLAWGVIHAQEHGVAAL